MKPLTTVKIDGRIVAKLLRCTNLNQCCDRLPIRPPQRDETTTDLPKAATPLPRALPALIESKPGSRSLF
jgi:hypothetical protein